jgi:acetoin:2,6-dichlorophenolindophenol oxidoreductase subunit alpha
VDFAMRMPDLGVVDDTVTVVRWLIEVGQWIERGEPLLEVETDKSIMELESAVSGRLQALAVPAGGEAAAGQVIATFMIADAGEPTAARRDRPPDGAEPGPVTNTAVIGDSAAVVDWSDPVVAQAEPALPAERISFFARNRRARDGDVAKAVPATYPAEFLRQLYDRMVLIREFEDGVKFLFLEGTMPGTIHQCQGQEATAVGVCAALEHDDFITSTFRGHGHALAKGLTPEELLFELFGAKTGCCKGKGGSMHVGNMNKGMVPGIAIVGGGVPLAAGMALAFKMQKSSQVVACFFGDGAIAEGAFHEGVNLAAIWNLPVMFVCENNLYGASTRVDLVMRNPQIAARADGYGIRGERVDGNDVLAVYEAARTAVSECRRGQGPVLLELLTYRRTGHSRRDACHYQPKEERVEWFARDPIDLLGRRLVEAGINTPDDLDGVRRETRRRFDAAVELARNQPMPSPEDLTTDVLA